MFTSLFNKGYEASNAARNQTEATDTDAASRPLHCIGYEVDIDCYPTGKLPPPFLKLSFIARFSHGSSGSLHVTALPG